MRSIFFSKALSALIVISATYSHARTAGLWYVETTNKTGILARVHSGNMFAQREFLVAFEYERRCDPIFSSLYVDGQVLGEAQNARTFPPNEVFVVIDRVQHTWHSVIVEYTSGREIGVGVTQSAWEALLASPKSVQFIENDGTIFDVPVIGLSSALQRGAELCANALQ